MIENEICRICLEEGMKLYPIKQTQMGKMFDWFSGYEMDKNPDLPNSVCYLCFAMLKRIYKFVTDMICTQTHLLESVHNKSKLTYEIIEKLKREMISKPHNLSQYCLPKVNISAMETDQNKEVKTVEIMDTESSKTVQNQLELVTTEVHGDLTNNDDEESLRLVWSTSESENESENDVEIIECDNSSKQQSESFVCDNQRKTPEKINEEEPGATAEADIEEMKNAECRDQVKLTNGIIEKLKREMISKPHNLSQYCLPKVNISAMETDQNKEVKTVEIMDTESSKTVQNQLELVTTEVHGDLTNNDDEESLRLVWSTSESENESENDVEIIECDNNSKQQSFVCNNQRKTPEKVNEDQVEEESQQDQLEFKIKNYVSNANFGKFTYEEDDMENFRLHWSDSE